MVSGRPGSYLFTMVAWGWGGWGAGEREEEGEEGREAKEAAVVSVSGGAERSEELRQGESKSGCQMSCRLMHWLTSLYRRREVRERHRQSVGRGHREREEIGEKAWMPVCWRFCIPSPLFLLFSSHSILPPHPTVYRRLWNEGLMTELCVEYFNSILIYGNNSTPCFTVHNNVYLLLLIYNILPGNIIAQCMFNTY